MPPRLLETTANPKDLANRWGVTRASLMQTDMATPGRGWTAEQSTQYLNDLAAHYKAGGNPGSMIEVRDSLNNLIDADGRHRLIAAAEAGVDRVPVKLYMNGEGLSARALHETSKMVRSAHLAPGRAAEIEGLSSRGAASIMRKLFTNFGSPWRGIAIGAGIGALGGWALGRRRTEPEASLSEQFGTATASSLKWGIIGAAAGSFGISKLGSSARGAGSTMASIGKASMFRPMKAAGVTFGGISRGIDKALPTFGGKFKGALAVLAMAGASTIALAASPRVHNEVEDQSETGTFGQAGMGVRERVGMLGASGDMVFGLNNSRHG